MKKLNLILTICCLAVSFTACTKKENTHSKIKLGFILATMNEERYAKDRDFFTRYANSKGADVEFAACDDKVNIQASKVETLLAKKIDALVIQPVNGEAASSLVAVAKKDGIPVVAYDRIIKNADIDLYVTQDSFKVGVLQAEAAAKAINGKGNVIILKGEAGHSVADEITKGNLSVFKKYPNIHVIEPQNHAGWSTALALATVENALTRHKNNIQAIIANNDGMALGAIQALQEQKLAGKVFVAGADADLTAVQNILKNKQTVTVLKGIKPLAEAAVDAAIHLVKKENAKPDAEISNGLKTVPVINTPVYLVSKENVDKQVVEYGFHPREAVYSQSE